MQYQSVRPAVFLSRPNRFIAKVEIDGQEETVHVKNTGRCKELLIPGRTVWLEEGSNPNRKTKYDLIAVDKDGLLVNMDAQAPNKVFAEWASAGQFVPNLTLLRPETTWGKSRFDFYWEAGDRKGFVEVKGCTLEDDGFCSFPDAPTERGVKHLNELAACMADGYEAAVCFVIQMEGMKQFSPNDATHPAFGNALRTASAAGVQVLALGCHVEPDRLQITHHIPVVL
jgi:sugar fermentation stimulation protein A